MRLALSARLTVDPKRLLESRWVHDTAHVLLISVKKAQATGGRREARRRH